MKVTIPVGWLIFFGLLLIAATYFLTEYLNEPAETVTIKKRKDYDLITFRLPNSPDPQIFGSDLWKARHTLAEWTPCSLCRTDAVSHEKFFHDWVNVKTGKEMKYPENYREWVNKICE